MAIPDNELWREFFNTYENLPELWKIKSDEFKNKYKKNKAWNLLFEVYKKIDTDATVEKLKNRINSIRTSYRRECKKMNDSFKSGAGEDDIYTSSIWYIHLLEFLKDQEYQQPGASSIDLETDPKCIQKPKKNKTDFNEEKVQFLKKAVETLESEKEEKDDAAIFSASWACSYRKLNEVQKLYAKKAIEDILILGQLNKLSLDTVQSSSTSRGSSSRTSTPYTVASSPEISPIFVSIPSFTSNGRMSDNTHSNVEYQSVQELLNDTTYRVD